MHFIFILFSEVHLKPTIGFPNEWISEYLWSVFLVLSKLFSKIGCVRRCLHAQGLPMLSAVFLPACYASTTNAINGLEDLALQKVCAGPRGRYPIRTNRLAPTDIDDVTKEQPPPPPQQLGQSSNTDFIHPSLQLAEVNLQKQRRSISEHPIRRRDARAPMLDASLPHPPQILDSLPKNLSFSEEPSVPEKSHRPKVRITVDKLNRIYKTYSRKFTAKMTDQKRATSINSRSQRKAEQAKEALEAIGRIERTPCMFSSLQDLNALTMQKAEVVRAISSRRGKKLVGSAASLIDDNSLHNHKSYLGKYYSLRYLDKIAECEVDKAIIASAKKLAADVGFTDDSKTKLWVKVMLDEEGYNISIRAPIDFLFEESPVHDTLQTIYETASERNICDYGSPA